MRLMQWQTKGTTFSFDGKPENIINLMERLVGLWMDKWKINLWTQCGIKLKVLQRHNILIEAESVQLRSKFVFWWFYSQIS